VIQTAVVLIQFEATICYNLVVTCGGGASKAPGTCLAVRRTYATCFMGHVNAHAPLDFVICCGKMRYVGGDHGASVFVMCPFIDKLGHTA